MHGNDFLKVVFDTDDPPGDPPEQKTITETPPDKPKTTDWESAYKGLQRQYDKLKKQMDELQTKFDLAVEELEGEKQTHRTVKTEKEQLTQVNVDLTSKLKGMEEIEANRSLEKERYLLILGEFADLAAFEAKGLLPSGSNADELRQKFTDFRDALSTSGDRKVQEVLKGTGTAAVGDTGNQGKRSKEQVYDELLLYSGKSDPESRVKYDGLMKEWIDLN